MALVIVPLDDLSACGLESVSVAFKMELARIVKDICDRDFDPSVREVRLTLKLKPLVGSDSGRMEATGEFIITSKIPALRTKLKTFKLRAKDGELLSAPDEPDEDENQTQFDFPRPEQQEEAEEA